MACQIEDCDQSTPLQSKYLQLMQLEEQGENAIIAIEKRQPASKRNFDKKGHSERICQGSICFAMEKIQREAINA